MSNLYLFYDLKFICRKNNKNECKNNERAENAAGIKIDRTDCKEQNDFFPGYTGNHGNICNDSPFDFTTNMFPSDCGCTPSATDICDHTVPTQVNSPVRGEAECFITSVEDLQANAIADTETPCSTCFEASTTGTCAYDYQSCDASDDIATFTDCIGALDDICRNE